MNDETKAAVEELRDAVKMDRQRCGDDMAESLWRNELLILAHIDGEPARLAAAREEQREACAQYATERHAAYGWEDREVRSIGIAIRATPLTATPLADEIATLRARVAELEAFGQKVSAIRDSIVGTQQFNWSEHAYPLVAALGAAGFEGAGHKIASANFGTLLDRLERAEAERDEYRKACESLNEAVNALRAERDALKAQAEAARAWCESVPPNDDENIRFAAADVLRAMDKAKP